MGATDKQLIVIIRITFVKVNLSIVYILNVKVSIQIIHFRPHRNSTERQTCVRARVEKSLKLANHRLKRVTEVKFLCVIIDENISWEPQINHLKKNIISSIIMIKRIKQFIPKN